MPVDFFIVATLTNAMKKGLTVKFLYKKKDGEELVTRVVGRYASKAQGRPFFSVGF